MAAKRKKARAAATRNSNTGRSRWPLFVAGMVAGVVATLTLQTFDPIGRVKQMGASDAPIAAGRSHNRAGQSKAAAQQSKPSFSFYTILPEMEVAVPEEELTPKAKPPAKVVTATKPATATKAEASPSAAAQAKTAGKYILQVGSFSKADDAERLKANIALVGLQAHIQTVEINGSDTWHRVRSGPYKSLESVNDARARLRENGVEAMVLKVRR